jgi:NADH-quinone oxidoreductase subunit G
MLGKAKAGAAAVFAEISKSVPAYTGLSYMKLAQTEEQFPDVGGRDLYYGGTASQNTGGLGVQIATGAERGEAVSSSPAHGSQPKADGLVAVPTTLLYDRGTTFYRSYVMHPRIPMPYVEINSADAATLGIADGETIVLSVNGTESQVQARVDGRAPAGAVLVPQSLGGPVLNQASSATVKKG